MDFPQDTIIRLNLAWIDNIQYLSEEIAKIPNDIFIDLPTGRLKPPNNSYSIDDLKPLINKFNNIKYLAISNVENPSDIIDIYKVLGDSVNLVPKIESKKGIENLLEICNALKGEKILMLDHDDLFTDLSRLRIANDKYIDYILKVTEFCELYKVKLLKTRGVIFSDKDPYMFT